MTKKSFDFEKLKQQTHDFSKAWQKKLVYLSDSVSRSGKEGVSIWLKSHHQIEELTAAIEELVLASEEDDFSLLQVDTTLSSFVIPEEDRDQAEWYKTAHNYLKSFEKKLIESKEFDLKLLEAGLNELKFISQSDDFHRLYRIQPIQEKVTKVYQDLQQAIADYKALEKEKLSLQKENNTLESEKLQAKKAEAEAKKAMMENIKIKEKRIAIIEDKKRKIAEKELLEAQGIQRQKDAEIEAKKAEHQRQEKLQEAYVDLQLEEKISQWGVEELINKVFAKLEDSEINAEQKNKIHELARYVDEK